MSEVIGHNHFSVLLFGSYNHEDLQHISRVGKAKGYDTRQVNIMQIFHHKQTHIFLSGTCLGVDPRTYIKKKMCSMR